MKVYWTLLALFSNFNSKVFRGMNFGKKVKKMWKYKFLPSAQMIDQTFRINLLNDSTTEHIASQYVVPQNILVKSKLHFS